MIMMMKWVRRSIFIVILIAIGIFVATNYSWVFAKKVSGEVIEIERITEPTAILGNRATEEQLHSYAMAIRDSDGLIHTASSEDRQWGIVKKGYCVDALFYRYPPWDLSKGGTFFNARMDGMRECKTAPTAPATVNP